MKFDCYKLVSIIVRDFNKWFLICIDFCSKRIVGFWIFCVDLMNFDVFNCIIIKVICIDIGYK